MKRFLKILNNKIIEDRYDSMETIQNGEIEDDGTYGKPGETLINGVWQKDPIEIEEEYKQLRIKGLKEIITNKKLLDMDCTAEQSELRGLLGL